MYRKILVPLDGSPTSACGLDEAMGLARATGASLVLLHVIDAFPLTMDMGSAHAWDLLIDGMQKHARELLEQAQATAREQGVSTSERLIEFPALRVADVIVDEARTQACDLIVMGTHGRRGFSHAMLGSDAERVLQSSPVPVLVVRHAEARRT